jgi:hypothetical protein
VVPAASDVGTPAQNGRVLARQHAAWLMLARCVYAGEHSQEHVGTPKMPGEPKRVQPSRDTDLKSRNKRS